MRSSALGSRRRSRLTIAGAVLVATLAVLAPTASAKPKQGQHGNSPAISFSSSSPAAGATLTAGDATFAFTTNRTPKQIRSLTCALSGPVPSVSARCQTPVATATGSSSGVSYTGLTDGTYTLTVTLTLTDGGTTTATRNFTVAIPTCTAGLENFGEDLNNSTPTVLNDSASTTPAGTISTTYDSPYVAIPGDTNPYGHSWADNFGGSTPYLDLDTNAASASVTFAYTQPVGSTSLDVFNLSSTSTFTLTAYDAAGAAVGTPATFTLANNATDTLTVSDTTDDIASVVLQQATGGFANAVVSFTNVSWGC